MTPELPHYARLTPCGDRLYLAVQMREYGKLVEAATREECANVCDERANGENDAQWCADRIRSMK